MRSRRCREFLKSLRRFCCLTGKPTGAGKEVPPPKAEPLRQLNLPPGAAVQNTNKCEGEQMKRKTMALVLALSLCLSLLTACGSGGTAADDKPPESKNAASSTEQPEESEKPEESGEPKEEEPEESAEPTQEEPKEEDNAGTAFLKLLQEEYKSSIVDGETQEHTYWTESRLASSRASWYCVWTDATGETVYTMDVNPHSFGDVRVNTYSYHIPTKTAAEIECVSEDNGNSLFFLDGWAYCSSERDELIKYQPGKYDEAIRVTRDSFKPALGENLKGKPVVLGDKIAFLSKTTAITSLDFELLGAVPLPEQEGAHGLIEPVELDFGFYLAVDGTVYTCSDTNLYRLDVEAMKWEDLGECNEVFSMNKYLPFYGRYYTDSQGVYNRLTGEQVFEYGDLYPSAAMRLNSFCYWGGDQYLGCKQDEYRWVNLKDGTMSEPLKFPEDNYVCFILNETYCVYRDDYGWFLWNYNTGEEETIYMFEQ